MEKLAEDGTEAIIFDGREQFGGSSLTERYNKYKRLCFA
jgi:hypothetical protein